jgi:hypothetical protein
MCHVLVPGDARKCGDGLKTTSASWLICKKRKKNPNIPDLSSDSTLVNARVKSFLRGLVMIYAKNVAGPRLHLRI